MPNFIRAIYHPDLLTVEYIDANGDHLLRSGGTIAWRFNNPGNLRPGSKYTLHIGQGATKNGNFLIFPTVEAGRIEKKNLLLRKYQNDSLEQMILKYAPSSENNTAKYIHFIQSKTGINKISTIGQLSEVELENLMQTMERFEGFNAKAETRKEQWVHTTKISLSDGARPIAGQEVTLKLGENIQTLFTDEFGQLPAIAHLKLGERFEIWAKNDINESTKIDSFSIVDKSQSFTYFRAHFFALASTRSHIPATSSDKKPPEIFSYVIQPGDTLGKIANKFKTSISQLQTDNQLSNPNKIFPGQRINIYGKNQTETALKENKALSSRVDTIPERSKQGQGQPLEVITSDQKRAPWMEIAIREAKQWAGKKEKVITKTDNYHHELGLGGNMGSTPWCASFVNYSLKESGFPYEKSASSQFVISSKKFKKIDKPVYGAIMVMKNYFAGTNKPHGTGHVTFVYGIAKNGKVAALGGNQGDQIKLSEYAMTGVSSTFNLTINKKKVTIEQKFYNFYIPIVYSSFADNEETAPEIDMDTVNKEFIGINFDKSKSEESTR